MPSCIIFYQLLYTKMDDALMIRYFPYDSLFNYKTLSHLMELRKYEAAFQTYQGSQVKSQNTSIV